MVAYIVFLLPPLTWICSSGLRGYIYAFFLSLPSATPLLGCSGPLCGGGFAPVGGLGSPAVRDGASYTTGPLRAGLADGLCVPTESVAFLPKLNELVQFEIYLVLLLLVCLTLPAILF